MKPLLHPSSFVIILFISMALSMISINIPTCLCDDDGQYTNCNAGFSCQSSSISENLKYPFWGGNREPYCGVSNSNMELICEGSIPKITINEVKYCIIGWDNTTQILTVARDDYWAGNICGVTGRYKNTTFDNTPFQRDGNQIANVTLLYNCDANQNQKNTLYSTTNCYGGTRVVYTVLGSSSVLCSPSVTIVIPIMGSQASQIVSTNSLTDVLKEGFELRYIGGDFAECGRCIDSGGVCGSDGGTSFRCFCKDEPHTTTCTSQKASSSSSSMSSSNLYERSSIATLKNGSSEPSEFKKDENEI